ncbi:hypothetical protein [Aurantiacibacter odishensis]|uniref:hypothetical protein n=1 Tax=Aurantiacibacter odishensis TaxID=1155476 RepID=UPI0013C42F5F|nr:hypothetical protein [Aurantiacibacter odishensis]
MAALGCILLLVLPIAGLTIGGWLAGSAGMIWGAGIGFTIALAICGVAGGALVKAGKRN